MKWFKMYSEVLHDRKVQTLPPELLRTWLNLLCIANENPRRGYLPTVEDVAYALRISDAEAAESITSLIGRGLLDRDEDGSVRPHNWDGRQAKEEKSTERVRRHRQKVRAARGSTPSNSSPATSPPPGETEVEPDETCFTVPVEQKWNGAETALEKNKRRLEGDKKRLLSNDSNRRNAGAVAGEMITILGGTFRIVSEEHRETIEHARETFGEDFAATVADRGSETESRLLGHWDLYRAAMDDIRDSERVIRRPHGLCMTKALEYMAHGVPRKQKPIMPAPAAVPLTKSQQKNKAWRDAIDAIDLSNIKERP